MKRTKNDGKRYEKLTREVFARTEDLQKMGATVQHDVVITGKSGTTHQVDVYVEFTAGAMTYKTIVSCKDLASPVKKSHLLELHGMVNDIPGQPRGILVSRSGFQKGAIEYARHHGLELYHLREKKDEDWEGLIKEVHITVNLENPNYEIVATDLDMD